jgi:hypothetical protein
MPSWLPSAEAWSAIGTFLAILVALFGHWFRAQIPWLQPKLRLEFIPQPEPVKTMLVNDAGHRYEDSFYFYGKVTNTRRDVRAATQVQVFLVRQEELLPNGQYQITSTKEVPIIWHLQEVKPTQVTIGHEETFPICSIVKGKWVQIHPLIKPLILKRTYREPFRIVLTFQAQSVETEYNLLRMEIVWHGGWSDDREKLPFHLTVTELPMEMPGTR